MHQGDINPDTALAETERAVSRRAPRFSGLSLEQVAAAAGAEFDRSAELQKEFAACREPRKTWCALVAAEYRKSRGQR